MKIPTIPQKIRCVSENVSQICLITSEPQHALHKGLLCLKLVHELSNMVAVLTAALEIGQLKLNYTLVYQHHCRTYGRQIYG